jgi:hypothetical protein
VDNLLARRPPISAPFFNPFVWPLVKHQFFPSHPSLLVDVLMPIAKRWSNPFSFVPDLAPNSIYLGHPLIFNHNDRTKAYEFILKKFRAKLTTIKANKLNHVDRPIYINSVLASIPIYYMSTILFSKSFISNITTIISNFW